MTKQFLKAALILANIAILPLGIAAPQWDCDTGKNNSWDCKPQATKTTSAPLQPVSEYSTQDIAGLLNWNAGGDNACHGNYEAQTIQYNGNPNQDNPPLEFEQDYASISKTGTSLLKGNVIITQPQRQVDANTVYFYRNTTTQKVNRIYLDGNVHIREPGALIVARTGELNMPSNNWHLNDILFRQSLTPTPLSSATNANSKSYTINGLTAWGRAEKAETTEPQIVDLYHATYTTCAPGNGSWEFTGSHVRLNKNTGRGTITNGLLYVRGVPVFYLPYFNFPIDDRRQTGFLIPTPGYSSDGGIEMTAPFYWNMAPNYDMLITPHSYGRRGVQVTDEFRYMTQDSKGDITLSFLPNDQGFTSFQNKEPGKITDPTSAQSSELRRLADMSNNRYMINITHDTQINPHWDFGINYTRVSDPYYLSDFGGNFDDQTANQLLQQTNLTYQGENWTFDSRLQQYQTLHPVDQGSVANQYKQLPALQYSGIFPSHPFGMDFGINNTYSYFDITKNPGQTTQESTGSRLNIQPSISRKFFWPYLHILPRAQMAFTGYQVNNQALGNPTQSGRIIPIIDLDATLYFEKHLDVFGKGFTQTLEPELYYLYVPYRDQSDLPLFGTTDLTSPLTFNYSQLFRDNRFSSIGRIGDANQLTVATTSRLYDSDSGLQKLSASIGEILYFKDRRVLECTDNDPLTPCPDKLPDNNTAKQSPLAGVLTYYITPTWHVTGGFAQDMDTHNANNQTLSVGYLRDNRHLLNLSYSFARDGDTLVGTDPDSDQNNLEQSAISFIWPLAPKWTAVGEWAYNWSHEHLQSYFYGVEYSTCCWAVRFVRSKTFDSVIYQNATDSYNNQYKDAYYLQFALKGLGNVGTSDPTSLLTNNISGYQPTFGQD